MSDDDLWFYETVDILADSPRTVLTDVNPRFSGYKGDEGRAFVDMEVSDSVEVDDLVWISEAVNGDVIVTDGQIGHFVIRVTEPAESGGEDDE